MLELADSIRLKHLEADNSYWAFDLKSGAHYELNETAFLLLQLIKEERSSEAVQNLAQEFDVEEAQVVNDLAELLSVLETEGLVKEKGTK